MEPHLTIPKRSTFFFKRSTTAGSTGKLFDQPTIIISFLLAVISLTLFWPVVSHLSLQNSYLTPPAAFVATLLGIFGFGEASRGFMIIFFVISDVGIYLLVRDFAKRQMPAILSAVIYFIPPIPVFVLPYFRGQSYQQGVGSTETFFNIIYGDANRLLAVALMPYLLIFFLRYLKRARRIDLIAAVSFSSLIFWSDYGQLLSLVLILATVSVTDFFLGQARIKFRRLITVLFFSILLTAFLYKPLLWFEHLMATGKFMVNNLKFLFPLPATLGILLFLFAFVFFAKKENRQQLFISFLTFAAFSFMVFYWLSFKRALVPYPDRLIPNLFIFTAIFISVSISVILRRVAFVEKFASSSWDPLKVFGYLAFGAVSFFILSVGAYLFSPFAVEAFSGPDSLWSKVVVAASATQEPSVAGFINSNFGLQPMFSGGWLVAAFLFVIVLVASRVLRNFLRTEKVDSL